ncbi:hypothetical protein AB4P91_22375 [Pseudomonas sp. B21128]|uniref:hypothetical protein n=1 Tax=Pseudomonas sp. B21128 TaxID=3235110 RepID=UPI00378524A4
MDPLFIEDTDDWLGTPTSLETCRHQLRMSENEFEMLTIKLERALENVEGLVRDNGALTQERNSLRAKLQYAEGDLRAKDADSLTFRIRETISSKKTNAYSWSAAIARRSKSAARSGHILEEQMVTEPQGLSGTLHQVAAFVITVILFSR